MKARYKVAIGIAGIAVLGGALAPTLGFGQQQGAESSLDKIVTKRFDDVSANQVFAWLVEQGFSFVVKDGEFDGERITMNIDHESLKSAANSVANALGGHWDRVSGKVFVFHKDDGYQLLSANKDGAGVAWRSQPGERVPLEFTEGGGVRVITPDSLTLNQQQDKKKGENSGDQDKDFDFDFDIPDTQWTPQQQKDFTKKMEQWGKKFGDNMKGFKFYVPDSDWTPEQQKDFQKKMEEWGKSFAGQMKNFNFNFSPDMKWTPEQQKDFQNKMEGWGKNFGKDMKVYGFDGGDKMTPEQRKDFEKSMKDWGQSFGEQMKSFKFVMPDSGWSSDNQKDFERRMEEWSKRLDRDMKGYHFENDHKLTPEQEKVLRHDLEDLRKVLKDEFKGGFPFNGSGKDWKSFGEGWSKFGEEMKKNLKDMPKPPAPPTDKDSDGSGDGD